MIWFLVIMLIFVLKKYLYKLHSQKVKFSIELRSQKIKFFVQLSGGKVGRVQGRSPANKRYSIKTLKPFH